MRATFYVAAFPGLTRPSSGLGSRACSKYLVDFCLYTSMEVITELRSSEICGLEDQLHDSELRS